MPKECSENAFDRSGRTVHDLPQAHDDAPPAGQALAGFYNGYSWAERMRKYEEMGRRLVRGDLSPPSGPCRLCGDPGDDRGAVHFEYHDEDYGTEYTWSEPAAYVLCRHCHLQRVHMRFTQPIAWQAFLAHVRRGGYARDLQSAEIRVELEVYRRALHRGETPSALKPLRPYLPDPGKEWFAKLSLDRKDMLRRRSPYVDEQEIL